MDIHLVLDNYATHKHAVTPCDLLVEPSVYATRLLFQQLAAALLAANAVTPCEQKRLRSRFGCFSSRELAAGPSQAVYAVQPLA